MAEIRLLGPVLIVADERTVDVGPPQRCAVLAALAVDVGRVVTTETLIDRVWGENPPEGARRSLHAHVARIRRLLNDYGDLRLVRRSGGYVLEADPDRVDLYRFRHLLDQADSQVTPLRQALALWQGDPLAGVTGQWAVRVRQGWRRQHLDAAVAWARAELRIENTAAVVGPLSELADRHPFHEPLIAVLMRALHATGNPTGALDLYTATRNRLTAELGIEPGAELVQAHQGILRGTHQRPQVSWPHRVGVVPPPANGFQNRDIALKLRVAGAAVISGLGGVGKTQLAAQAARQLWSARELDLLVWVTAASRDALISAYAQASADLVLGPDGEAPEAAADRLLAWLASTGRRWLVVLDDVALPADVRGLWPPDQPAGRTIVTTRRRDATLLSGRSLVEVGVFTHGEAVDFLTGTLPSHLADDVPGVATDLGSLPLALSHAAAYMVDQDLTCTTYRRRFADRNRRLAGLFPDPDTLFDNSPRTVATTWTLSIEAADRLAPAGLARPLFELASLLDPNGIPDTLFATQAARRYLASRSRAEPDQDEIRDGLRSLYRFHLITHEDGLVRVHALLQRAVRENLTEPRVTKAVADALVDCWPNVDERVGQILRANSAALQLVGSAALWDNGIHPVLLRTIDSLGAAGHLTEAIKLCQDLSEQAVDRLGPTHHDALVLRNKLAVWLGDAGLLQEALACLRQLVVDVAAALGPDHPSAMDARQNLGYQYGQAGDPAKAMTELTITVADRVRTLGPDHLTVFVCRDQLAYWRGKAGDSAGAVAELEELRPRAKQVLGAEHSVTLGIAANLAHWLGHSGEHGRAMSAFQELLADAERVLGPTNRDLLVYRHNSAYWQWQAGDLTGAAEVLGQVLTQRLRIFGPKHRDTLATRHHLAGIRAESADPAHAAVDLENVLADMMAVFGPIHPATLSARSDLAHLWGRLGDPAIAVTALDEVLADQQRVLGPDHQATVATQEKLDQWRAPASRPHIEESR
jgi:DNA-binding SARP family transcriptional activator